MGKTETIRAWASASAVLLVAAVPVAALAQQAPRAATESREFNVPAQPLSRAALRLSDQADVQIMVDSAVAEGLQGNAVRGRYTVAEAVNRLLAGSGLTWRYVSPGVVSIERPAAAAAAAAEPPITGDRVFGAVNIQGQRSTAENGFADVEGFGQGAGSNGSSDVLASEGTGSLTTNGSVVASRLPQPIQETTQSVSTLTFERLKQQNIIDLNSALAQAPGVTVQQRNGTDSTFISRGYEITTFSVDGGAPFGFIQNARGSVELSQYDRVEVVRGSAGQFGSFGGPGGQISLIRKRPLDHFQMNLEVGYASYDNLRGEYDVTGPIGFDDHLRARFVLSGADRDFFYDQAHQTRGSGYGVFEADLGSRTVVRAGGSYQLQRDRAFNLNGLPRYATGEELPLPRSTNFQAPYANQEIDTTELFGAFEHRFATGWNLNLDATRRVADGESIYAVLTANSIFPSTVNPQIRGNPVQPTSTNTQLALSGSFTGRVRLFGLDQNFVAGVQYSKFDLRADSIGFSQPFYIGSVFNFNPDLFARRPGLPTAPSFTGNVSSTTSIVGQTKNFGAYFTVNLNPIEPLHINGGVRYNDLRNRNVTDPNFSFFNPPAQTTRTKDSDWTFNGSVSYDVLDWLAAYASYNEIFNPQSTLLSGDTPPQPLSPASGQTIEGGVRFKLRDGKLNGSVAYYDTRQSNLSFQITDASGAPVNPLGLPGCCFTQIATDKTHGVDVELAGQLTRGWQIQANYNYNKNKRFGDPLIGRLPQFNTQQPRHSARLFTVYDLPGDLSRLTVGVGGRLESKRVIEGLACLELNAAGNACLPNRTQPFQFSQPTYAVGDAFLRYRVRDTVVLALNVTNFTDKKYFAQTGDVTGKNFYGEPRQVAFSIRTSLGDRR